jgi:hypothetical protein
VIRDRNLPLAKLIPFKADHVRDQELRLVAAGKMRLPRGRMDIKALLRIPTANVARGQAIQALLDEREEGL